MWSVQGIFLLQVAIVTKKKSYASRGVEAMWPQVTNLAMPIGSAQTAQSKPLWVWSYQERMASDHGRRTEVMLLMEGRTGRRQ